MSPGHSDDIKQLVVQPDSGKLAVGMSKGDLILYDMEDDRVISQENIGNRADCTLEAAQWQSTQQVAVVGWKACNSEKTTHIAIWDAGGMQAFNALPPFFGRPTCLSGPVDGTSLLVGDEDGSVRLIDIRGKESAVKMPHNWCRSVLSVSSHGGTFVQASFSRGTQVWDIRKTSQPLMKVPHNTETMHNRGSLWLHTSAKLVVCDGSGVSAWDATRSPVDAQVWSTKSNPQASTLAVDPSDDALVAVSANGVVTLFTRPGSSRVRLPDVQPEA